MKKGLVLILLAIGVVSCEKNTYVEYVIDNQSSGSIIVEGYNLEAALPINTEIFSDDNSQIAIWSERKLISDALDPVVTLGTDLVITKNGVTTTVDYTQLSNWTVDIQEEKRTANHVYTLVLTNNDF